MQRGVLWWKLNNLIKLNWTNVGCHWLDSITASTLCYPGAPSLCDLCFFTNCLIGRSKKNLVGITNLSSDTTCSATVKWSFKVGGLWTQVKSLCNPRSWLMCHTRVTGCNARALLCLHLLAQDKFYQTKGCPPNAFTYKGKLCIYCDILVMHAEYGTQLVHKKYCIGASKL